MVATALAAVGSLVAAIAAWKSANSWRVSQRFDSRSKAVQAWVGEAAAFRGRLKFVYKKQLKWPEDKTDIEYLSGHFFLWVALWPSVRASLDGDLVTQAESLWGGVFTSYSALMDGSGDIDQLGVSVESVYNSDLLKKVLANKS